MKFPPYLLAAVLLVWGWQNDQWLLAVSMGFVLELPRFVRWRWLLSKREFERLADASSVLFLGVIVYQFYERGFHGIYGVLEWLPAVLFFLMAAQLYSDAGRINLSALIMSLRRSDASRDVSQAPATVDLRYSYVIACLLSASAGATRSQWFFVAVCGVGAWALWSARSRRFPRWLWASMMGVGIAVGFAGQLSLVELRRTMEPLFFEWFHEHFWVSRDPYRAYTALGAIGKLKGSERIVLRVRAPRELGGRLLLREASYQTFAWNRWIASATSFSDVTSQDDGLTWFLDAEAEPRQRLEVSGYLRRNRGLLAVPGGANRIDGLIADNVAQNPLGSLKVYRPHGPSLVEYGVAYDPTQTLDSPPSEHDRKVPFNHRALMDGLVTQLGLDSLAPQEVLGKLSAYFSDGFRYTLDLGQRSRQRPLEYFLTESRQGHCEFFASATVLALRAAGIPARYAVGYSVQEYSELEKQFVVRRRHSHSWALAYIDGRWRDVDTTPSVWADLEAGDTAWWQPVYNGFAWLSYQFTRWRLEEADEADRTPLLGIALLLALVLAWRLYRRRRVVRDGGTPAPALMVERQGVDSSFYRIEERLLSQGHDRARGETLQAWLTRLLAGGEAVRVSDLLNTILPAHYRYRFDPGAPNPTERAALERRVDAWLRK